MNRILLVLNGGLTALLVILVCLISADIGDRNRVEGTPLMLGAKSVRLEPATRSDPRFFLDFTDAMVNASAVGEPTKEKTVVLEPAVAVQCTWVTASKLQILPLEKLRPATRYTFHPDPLLKTLDGRGMPRKLQLVHRTGGLELLDATVVSSPDSLKPGSQAFLLTFNLPVKPDALRKALVVRGPGDKRVPVTVEAVEKRSDPAYKVTLRKGEDTGTGAPRCLKWVTLHVHPSLAPARGDFPLGKTVSTRVSFMEDLLVRDMTSTSRGIEIDFNHQVCLPEKEMIRIRPPRPFQMHTTWRGLRLVGDFPPGESLSICLLKGFPGRGRVRLPRMHRHSLRIRDRDPELRFLQKGRVLSSRAEPELLVEGVNVSGFEVTVRSVYPNNVVRLMQERRCLPDAVFGPVKRKKFEVEVNRNVRFQRTVLLRDLVGKNASGFHLVKIRDLDGKCYTRPRQRTRLIQITDLGVTVRATPDAVAVHVVKLAAGCAVEGASVRVLTPTNQELARGRTDGEGVAVLRFRKEAVDHVPFLVAVEKGGDATFVDMKGFAVDLASDALGGRPYLVEGLEAYVAFDRGAVRPGEEVHATVVVRDERGIAPAMTRLEARWIGPDRKVRRTGTVEAGGTGLAVAALRTGLGAPTGSWALEVRDREKGTLIGRGSFLVEAFVPDRLEAEVTLVKPLRMGCEGLVRVKGSWLEGGPAEDRPVRVHIRYDHGTFRPDGYEGYAFGRCDRKVPPGARPEVRSVLDRKGEAVVRFQVPESRDGLQVLTARIVVEVLDPSGRPVRAGLIVPVLRPDFLLGLKVGEGRARVVALTPEGKVHEAPVPLAVTVERRYWHWKRCDRGDGTYRYDCTVKSDALHHHRMQTAEGKADIRFKDESGTWYGWLVLVVRSGNAVVDRKVGEVPLRPDQLRVSGPPHPVAPGSEAVIFIDAPFGGTAFVTLEGTTLHGTRVAAVKPGRTRVNIQVPPALTVPNIHAVVTLTAPQAGENRDGPTWIAGGTSIPVAQKTGIARVTVEAPAEVMPESTVKVRILAPGTREAVVALVDEGILNVTRHPDPDPAAFFLARRRLDSSGADTGIALLEGAKFRPDALVGGDGGEELLGPRLRGSTSRFIETVALFKGPIPLDDQGEGEAVFTLPPYEGRLRAMVIAAGPGQAGGGVCKIVVKAPIGLRLAVPRMLAPGDETRVLLTVRNSTGLPDPVHLTFEAMGGLEVAGGLRVEGDNIRNAPGVLNLKKGEVRTVPIPVTAGDEIGGQGLRVTARCGKMARCVEKRFVVRPPARYDVERIGLAVKGATTVRIPGTWVPGTCRARVVAGGCPTQQLWPALDALVNYPYGCVEQTTSRCMSLLACRSLCRKMRSGKTPRRVESTLEEGIDRLFTMQTHRGGLSMWPGGRREYVFGTVYALDFLLSARAAGIAVPEIRMNRVIDRVVERLTESGDDSLRAYCAEVLSRAGRPVSSWLTMLSERSLCSEDRARLALAFSHLGRDEEARAMLSAQRPARPRTLRETGGFLRSPLRRRAVELRAFLAVEPGHTRIPEGVQELLHAVLRPGTLNTQELGQALRALACFYDAHAAETGGREKAVVQCSGKVHSLAPDKPLSFDVEGGAEVAFRTRGRLYGLLEVSGFRIDTADARVPGLMVRRSIIDEDTGKPAKKFQQGGVYRVVLAGTAETAVDNLLVTDVVPGGFEIENPRLGVATSRRFRNRQPGHLEIRDDRVLLFASQPVLGDFTYEYRMRAVFPGTFHRPGFVAESLYVPGVRTRGGGGGRVTIH